MTHRESLSKGQLLELLELLDQSEQQHALALQTKEAEFQTQRDQLRQQDVALQTKDLTIKELTQERDEYKLAFDKLMQQRFRNRSERYIDNPDQLRLEHCGRDHHWQVQLSPAALSAAGLLRGHGLDAVAEHTVQYFGERVFYH